MKKTVITSVIVIIAATVVLVVGAMSMTRSDDPSQASGPTESQGQSSISESAVDVADRPDCPAAGAGGVELECLGGSQGPAQADPEHITVVNVWAWWCGPCRDELPYVQEFSDANPQYTVVGVHADAIPGNGAAMLNEMGLSLPSYSDTDNSFAGTLGLPNVIPITVVFRGEEQIGVFPTPFGSAAEINAAVTSVL
ncbi:TlpA family protein disulfide reductase [Corynebacterium cystitidis]|uniref:TlpA family protein disulfide reductase n=1 Tax=Corynebacterium cystitidis TaxID=35757 RepID=UPI00211F0337|nr:TlpA disulfide reductase family protein [Corynebacterium cystitidis]